MSVGLYLSKIVSNPKLYGISLQHGTEILLVSGRAEGPAIIFYSISFRLWMLV